MFRSSRILEMQPQFIPARANDEYRKKGLPDGEL